MMRAPIAILALALAGSGFQQLTAQQFDLRKSTQTEFGGALDFIMDLFGASNDQVQRIMVSGDLATVRTDDIEDGELRTSNVVTYSTGDVHIIDHQDESYYTFNLGAMLAEGPLRYGGQPPAQQPERDQQEVERPNEGAEYEVSIEFDSPGGTKNLLGYRAEQMWMTITATPTRAPEGVSLDSMPIFKMLTELWVAEDFPGNEAMAQISEEAAAQLSSSIGVDGSAMAEAFSMNAQFEEAFEQNQEEMEKLRNMPLERLSVFVSLPPGAEFNPDSALYGSMGELKIDVAGAVASGVANAVTGGIGRRFGIGGRDEEESAPPPVGQTLMFRVHELVESFNTGPLESGWNLVPETYEQKESPFAQRPPNG